TILPIDKIIGRIYPILGAILVIGTVAVGITLFTSGNGANIPALSFENMHPEYLPIFPILFNDNMRSFIRILCDTIADYVSYCSKRIRRTLHSLWHDDY